MYGAPPRAAIEAMLTMRPQRALEHRGQDGPGEEERPGGVHGEVPRPEREIGAHQSGADSAMPALLTRTSTSPSSATMRSTPAAIESGLRDVHLLDDGRGQA